LRRENDIRRFGGGRGPGLCPGVHFRRTRPWLQATGEWRAEGSSLGKGVAMKRLCSVLALLPLLALFALGQNPEIVTVKVVPPAAPLKAGQSAPITLELTIKTPYHINADQPLEDFLIGTTVDFKAPPGVVYKKIAFPPAEVRKLDLSPNPMAIYEGAVRITAEVVLAPDFKAAEFAIEGSIGYQACDNSMCLPPAEVKFSKKVTVAGGTGVAAHAAPAREKAPAKKEEPSPTAAAAPADDPLQKQKEAELAAAAKGESPKAAVPGKPSASPFGDRGLPLTFLLVFLGGLALNLTPCIYPLIPITISYFGGQAEGKKGGVVAHAVIYVLGMAATYSVLGVIAAFTGSLFGMALQYPPVLIGIALIMVVLALSMFDVYELRMPAFLNKFAGGSQKGYFGTFFMGLTVGIIAAPCIGPFVLGLLTYVGNRGNVVLGFSLFFVLALGLGVPFLILGIFSGSLAKIPRSGAWMVWVRTIFGFILVGMALYFLKSLFPNPLLYDLSLALTMLLAGIYMAWIEPTKTPGKVFPFVRNVIGAVFFVLALLTASGGIRGYLDEQVNARIQGMGAAGGAKLEAIAWTPYSEEKLAAAAREGKTVFIDFFTDWCIACKEMDRDTFSRPEVVAASRDFVMLRSNLTTDKDPVIKELYRRYQVRGVPTYVFLGPDGKELSDLRLVGFEPKKDFLPRLKKALNRGKE
jgi:thiol:disulfide interchange protein DsbD